MEDALQQLVDAALAQVVENGEWHRLHPIMAGYVAGLSARERAK
jgi:hypothetical protein